MKKKGLLILLVVFLVAILTFSVFACGGGNKDKGDGGKKPATDTDDKDDGKNDTGLSGRAALKAMLNDIVKTVDDTVKVAGAIENQASITATIFVDVEVYDEEAKEMVPYHVELNIMGSMDKTNADKTWALVQADILGVKANIFAVDSANGETLYIGQNILNEGVKWSKLSQFKDANLLTDFVCKELFGLIGKLQQDSGDKLEAGILSGVEGLTGILDIAGNLTALIQPADKADYTTATGYGAKLDLSGLSGVMGMLGSLNLTDDIKGIIEMVGGILLGGTLDLDNAAAPFTPGEEKVDIGLSVDKNADGTFAGLGLSYKRGENLKVAFGLKDVAFKAASLATSDNAIVKAAYEDVKSAGELAIALNLDLNLPGVSEETLKATINVFPNIKVGFVDGAVKADFSDMYAYADLVVGENTYEIAQYNVNEEYPEDLIINLEPLFAEFSAEYKAGGYSMSDMPFVYRVPVDLQAKTGNWTAPAPANAEGGASTNIIDVLYTKIAGMFGPEGFKFDIGAIMGLVGELENIGAAFESYKDNITMGKGSITVNFETLMAELLAPNTGLISTIQSDWNNFSLIKYVDEVPTLVENLKLADLLKKEDVLANIVALVNSSVYDGYVKGYVPADEEDVPYSYADFYAYVADELTVDQILTTIKAFTGADISATNLYENLALTLAGHAQTADGIGASIAISAGADDAVKTASIGLSLKLIENKAVYTGDVIAYEGDVMLREMVSAGRGEAPNYDKAYSNNTGNDGAALLLEALKALVLDIENGNGILAKYLEKAKLKKEGSYNIPTKVTGNISYVSDGNDRFFIYKLDMGASVTLTWTGDVEVMGYTGQPYSSGATIIENGAGIQLIVIAANGVEVNITAEVKPAPAGTKDDPIVIGLMDPTIVADGRYFALTVDAETSIEWGVYGVDVYAVVGDVETQIDTTTTYTLAEGTTLLKIVLNGDAPIEDCVFRINEIWNY
ncbi:MAG: hypothetical protein IKA77_05165 [Clostridia bacterium]|nr:hypothetical protein [Clostridia bacterium]